MSEKVQTSPMPGLCDLDQYGNQLAVDLNEMRQRLKYLEDEAEKRIDEWLVRALSRKIQ